MMNSGTFRYLDFCPEFFGHVGIQLDKKSKANLKIYDVTDWTTNNSNTLPQFVEK